MEIFELAAELGKALKADERLVKLEEAKKAVDEFQAELEEYFKKHPVARI